MQIYDYDYQMGVFEMLMEFNLYLDIFEHYKKMCV